MPLHKSRFSRASISYQHQLQGRNPSYFIQVITLHSNELAQLMHVQQRRVLFKNKQIMRERKKKTSSTHLVQLQIKHLP